MKKLYVIQQKLDSDGWFNDDWIDDEPVFKDKQTAQRQIKYLKANEGIDRRLIKRTIIEEIIS